MNYLLVLIFACIIYFVIYYYSYDTNNSMMANHKWSVIVIGVLGLIVYWMNNPQKPVNIDDNLSDYVVKEIDLENMYTDMCDY